MPRDKRFRGEPKPFDWRFQPGERVVPEVVLPAGRTVIVAAEDRMFTVKQENRVILVNEEDRIITISL